MSAATSILSFVVKEIKPSIVAEYFPSTETFQNKISLAISSLDKKIDEISRNVSSQAIQSIRRDYISNLNYIGSELVPFVKLEFAGEDRNQKQLSAYASEIRNRRIELSASFEESQSIIEDRLSGFDFAVRNAFEIQQGLMATRLVLSSWEYFLYCAMDPLPSEKIKLLVDNYKNFKMSSTSIIEKNIDPLCKARLEKISFTKTFKKKFLPVRGPVKEVVEWPVNVKYEYIDSFYSSYSTDPFKSDEIKESEDVGIKWYDLSVFYERKKALTAKAFENMIKYEKACASRKSEIEALNEKHIKQPAKDFISRARALADDLPNATNFKR